MTFENTKLVAYLNGDVSAQLAAEIEAACETDASLQYKLMELDPISSRLADSFSQIARLPGRARLDELATVPSNTVDWMRHGAMAACVAGGIAIGLIAGGKDQSADQSDWRHEVARYHALYITETLASVKTEPAVLDTQFARASNAIDLQLDPDTLKNLGDLDLKRAQILGLAGQEIIQVALSAPDGTPFAFCITRNTASASAVSQSKMLGLSSASWDSKTHQFIVIGGQNDAKIAKLASELSSVFF